MTNRDATVRCSSSTGRSTSPRQLTTTSGVDVWDLYLAALTAGVSAAVAQAILQYFYNYYFYRYRLTNSSPINETDTNRTSNTTTTTATRRRRRSNDTIQSCATTPRRSNHPRITSATNTSDDSTCQRLFGWGDVWFRRLVNVSTADWLVGTNSVTPFRTVSMPIASSPSSSSFEWHIPLWLVWGMAPAYASLPLLLGSTKANVSPSVGVWVCWGLACFVTMTTHHSRHDETENDDTDPGTDVTADGNVDLTDPDHAIDEADVTEEASDTFHDLCEEKQAQASLLAILSQSHFVSGQTTADAVHNNNVPSTHSTVSLSREAATMVAPIPTTVRTETISSGKPPVSRSTNVPPLPATATQHHKYLELLVHNVSHTDVIFGLDIIMDSVPKTTVPTPPRPATLSLTSQTTTEQYMRPRFSSFDLFCRLILHHMMTPQPSKASSSSLPAATIATTAATIATTAAPLTSDQVVYFPRYQRSMDDPRYAIRDYVPTKEKPQPPRTPTGFQLPHSVPFPPHVTNEDVRLHENHEAMLLDAWKKHDSNSTGSPALAIRRVFFPLLATILPVWHRHIQEKEYHSTVKRVLILVTGVGTPRNQAHSSQGNSTQACAELMRLFLARVDPTLTVVSIHSETNVFRYDENLLFCERELMPTIHAYRDAHATGIPYPDEFEAKRGTINTASNPPGSSSLGLGTTMNFDDSDWRTSMHVTLSFADGSPARTHAIQASLRSYKPTYFHFWQLKTFWHESKVVDDDIEVHSFETMETLPAVDADRVRDPGLQLVVQEMRAFYDEMTATLLSGQNDIHSFWLRKTHKPVLAVLLVQSSSEQKPRLYRGTNMEVSMPTGSLCAERSAIGSALAANPNLKRHDLKLIAVLAVPPVEAMSTNEAANMAFSLTTAPVPGGSVGGGSTTRVNMRRVSSYSSIVVEDAMDDSRQAVICNSRKSSFGSEYDPNMLPSDEWVGLQHAAAAADPLNSSICSSTTDEQQGVGGLDLLGTTLTEPLRRISLFSKSTPLLLPSSQRNHRPHPHPTSKRRTVVVSSAKDANPLAPCGACNEWLKKIAESNPYFRIVTFTDANCNGIYVSPCKE